MSGIEVAGLLLGAFPLIISAMEHYQDVKRPTAIWWKIRKAHKKDYNRVKECEILFRDQLELLLCPLLDDHVLDAPQYEQLLANPGGEGWKESHIEDALTERLQHRYTPYLEVMTELKEAMGKLCKASRVDDPQFQAFLSDKHGLNSPSSSHTNARNILMAKANVVFQGKRIKYSLTNFWRTELLEEAETCIRRLKALLKASAELSDHSHGRKTGPRRPVSKKLLGFWQHAANIYKLLQTAWSCSCRGEAHLWLQHYTSSVDAMKLQLPLCHGEKAIQVKVKPPSLQLKRRTIAGPELRQGSLSAACHVHNGLSALPQPSTTTLHGPSQGVVHASSIGILIHTVQTATLLPPLPQTCSTTTTTSALTADICKSFEAPCIPSDCVCVLQEGDDEYGVYSASRNNQPTSTISISECLSCRDLTRVQRCHIVLAIASAHLQLHSSPWLHHSWDADNIRLPVVAGTLGSRIICAEPYVLADLDKAIKPWPRKDASFTSLGIVLLELCFNQRFTDHQLWRNYPGKEQDPLIRLAIAQDWADSVSEEAGEDYALAVKWALKEAPAVTHTNSWRADFAQNVVQPLQRCCEFLKPRK